MKRTALVCGLVCLLAAAACGGGSSSPTAPAGASAASAPLATQSISAGGGFLAAPGSSAAPGFGVIVSDAKSAVGSGASGLSACFGASPTECFSASRLSARAVVGAAATLNGAGCSS